MKPEVAIKVSHKYFFLPTICEFVGIVNMHVLLTNFFFAFLWTETNSRSITTQKRTRPISSHLDRTSLVSKRIFSCGTNAGNPEQAGWAHLARSGSQSERRIRFTFPACRFSHIILLVRILCLVLVLFRGWWTQYFSLFYPHPGDSLEAYHGGNFWNFSKKTVFFFGCLLNGKNY